MTVSMSNVAALVVAAVLAGCPAERIYVFVPVDATPDTDAETGTDGGAEVGDTDGGIAEVDAPTDVGSEIDGSVGAEVEVEVSSDVDDASDTGDVEDVEASVCVPDTTACLDATTSGVCAADGLSWATETTCEGGDKCHEASGTCEPIVCLPEKVACEGEDEKKVCLESGTGWSEPYPCPAEHVCVGAGKCVLEECLGTVLLVMDGSASMAQHWNTVRQSVAKLAQSNPLASLGMLVFPEFPTSAATGCEIPEVVQVPPEPNNALTLNDWFQNNTPYGQTPLVDVMTRLNQLAPSVFGSDGGAVVVLSDGADTCAYPNVFNPVDRTALIVADLEASTASLFEDHGVKTYVIGYNYQGDPAQLQAIALSGGTGKSQYTPAGDETELTNALVDVYIDLKLCVSSGGN